MNNKAPSFTTPPPPVLVQTWLLMACKKGEHFHYARKRAIDLLELIFGDLTNAQQYVDKNKKPQHTINVA